MPIFAKSNLTFTTQYMQLAAKIVEFIVDKRVYKA